MAGHSQYANIKHRKGAQDAKRSKKFTKLRRQIIVAARSGIPNPELNANLRSVIHNASREGLSKDKIKSAIESALGNTPEDQYEEIIYEGYGIEGVAFIVRTLTNNRNRTASEIRHIFTKFGGNLAEAGSVTFLFNHLGEITYENVIDFNELFDFGIDIGIIDIINQEKQYILYCNKNQFSNILQALNNKFGTPKSSEIIWRPESKVSIDKNKSEAILKIFEALESNDDVQDIYTNLD
jgi:YebC/PmpR family DNA-binding regulatory protein